MHGYLPHIFVLIVITYYGKPLELHMHKLHKVLKLSMVKNIGNFWRKKNINKNIFKQDIPPL